MERSLIMFFLFVFSLPSTINARNPSDVASLNEDFVSCLGICRCKLAEKYVDCSNLGLKGVPEDLPHDLVILDLSGNEIIVLDEVSFIGLRDLQELYLKNNKIAKVHDNTFSNSTLLKVLDLSDNNLDSWSGNITSKIANSLIDLDLSKNAITELTSRTFNVSMLELRRLNMDENGIRLIEDYSFQHLPNLRFLSLKINVVKSLSPEGITFHGLDKLEELYLDSNFFNYFPETNAFFPMQESLSVLSFSNHFRINFLPPLQFPRLKRLNVSLCKLDRISNFTFSSTPDLEELDLSNNVINFFEIESLHGLMNLKNLQISRNRLLSFPYRALLNVAANLKKLFADYLDLVRIPSSVLATDETFFQNLTYLSLQHNRRLFSVEKDSFFKNLKCLSVLKLSFSSLPEIPTDVIAQLINLEEFEFNGNKIKHLNKSSFPTLTRLRHLSLDQSESLTHIGSESFDNVKEQLSTLSITDSALTSIDKEAFVGLSSLSQISLTRNKLNLAYPEWFEEKKLETLELSNNPWKCNCELKPFRQWLLSSNYTDVSLRDTPTCYYPRNLRGVPISSVNESVMTCEEGTCPDTCLCLFQSSEEQLIGADCSGEDLEEIPSSLPSSVQKLQMNYNLIPSLTSETLKRFPRIQEASFSNNKITTLQAPPVTSSHDLTKLVLSHNLIDLIPIESFSNLTSLRELRLDNNLITNLTLTPFIDLRNLILLDLSNNNIQWMNQESFSGLGTLWTLILSHNYINQLPSGLFQALSSVEEIFLKENRISFFQPGQFEGLSKLKILDISKNQFKLLERFFVSSCCLSYLKMEEAGVTLVGNNSFSGLPNLRTLRLKDNFIANISDNAFKIESGTSQITSLDLDNNKLAKFPMKPLEPLVRLQSLHLNGNPIEDLPCNSDVSDVFLPELSTLYLAQNNIKNISNSSIFCHFSKLETLVLNDNKLSQVPPHLHLLTPNLKLLSLDNNLIESISSDNLIRFDNLTVLSLNFNSFLTQISENTFSMTPNLQELHISSGALRNLDYNAFSGLKYLQLLDLSDNQLTTPDSGWFQSFQPDHLISVAMFGNEWKCDCASVAYKEWLSINPNGLTANGLSIVCEDPYNLKGTSILEASITCPDTSSFSPNDATTHVEETTSGTEEIGISGLILFLNLTFSAFIFTAEMKLII